ncbi:hypothetical protein M3Y99_00485200 [Aphelenchoides fujianensis]|nr:hypothetical protein M3Y99_00485200 [Aphelenchoides fujianensis]
MYPTVEEIAAPSLQPAAQLSTTGYSVGWTLRMLAETNRKFEAARDGAKVEELTAYDISEGKGFMSRVYKCTARFDRPQSAAYSFVMKMPTFECFAAAAKDMKMSEAQINRLDGWRGKFVRNFYLSSMNWGKMPKMFDRVVEEAPGKCSR